MNNEFLKYCKYYKGEEKNPYNYYSDHDRACFWEAEERYCNYKSNKSRFENEEYITMMTEAVPEIKHITENKSIPIQTRAMVAYLIDDIAYHSPMSDTTYFANY